MLLAAFGSVDEPLASCMIVHFSAHIWKWELVCKFGVIFHIFIISCLGLRFHAWLVIFYSIIIVSYTKYFVHSYTADVVFTLSYQEKSVKFCVHKISAIILRFQSVTSFTVFAAPIDKHGSFVITAIAIRNNYIGRHTLGYNRIKRRSADRWYGKNYVWYLYIAGTLMFKIYRVL